MDTIALEYSDDDLLHRLRGRVFHRTPYKCYLSILKDGFVYANKKGKRFAATSGRPECYGNCRDLVCLFDLRSVACEEIHDGYTSFMLNPPRIGKRRLPVKRMVYLILSPKHYESLISGDTVKILDDPSACGYHIPKIECWFAERIPVDYFETALCVRVKAPVAKKPSVMEKA